MVEVAMSVFIAWALIGAVFFAGIALEHRDWDRRDALHAFPALLMVIVMWPAGLAYWWVVGRKRQAGMRGHRRG